jgi:AraC-like DNA-binding protein
MTSLPVIGTDVVQALTKELISLYDELPGILFWIKDADLRILEVNTAFAVWVNLPKSAIIGKTDADLYFPELAKGFMDDDETVIRTGQAIVRKGELLTNRFGIPEWRSTTKRPVLDPNGKAVATIGISRPLPSDFDRLPAPFEALARLILHAREALADGVDVPALAAKGSLSLATLNRLFRRHLRLSPGEFLHQLRISRACRLLQDSPLNITEIAQQCGYESPAAFARAFRQKMLMSPSAFRAQQPNSAR